MPELKHSPLDSSHRSLGAKMVEFGGWEMPVAYPLGTVKEHLACRSGCVMFDVSHLGTVRLESDNAFELLQAQFSNDLRKIEPGRAQYTHLLDDNDGSVIDDIIVWWVDRDRFDVMPNASNTDSVLEAIGGIDITKERAVIAIQGPESKVISEKVIPGSSTLGRFRVAQLDWEGVTIIMAGTGYTGEDGIECAIEAQHAYKLWNRLLEAGAVPAGLGARDTLRLEAGLVLHGHELGPTITPQQAGLNWVIGWDKEFFSGKKALEAENRLGIARKLIGLKTNSRKPPRSGSKIFQYDDVSASNPIGEITSGNFSPVLGVGIAMGFISTKFLGVNTLRVMEREVPLECTVVDLPFVAKNSVGK